MPEETGLNKIDISEFPDDWRKRRMPMATRVSMIAVAFGIVAAAAASGSRIVVFACIPLYVAAYIFLTAREEKQYVADMTLELRRVMEGEGVTVATAYLETIETAHGRHAASRIRSNLGLA